MLLIILLIITLGLFVMSMVLFFSGKKKTPFIKKILFGSVITAMILTGLIFIAKSSVEITSENLNATYSELKLYYNTVNASTNEYLRHHYYEEITEFNQSYEDAIEMKNHLIYGVFYEPELFETIKPINFKLKGDE